MVVNKLKSTSRKLIKLRNNQKPNYPVLMAVSAAFALIGALYIFSSRAAGPFVALEAESGTRSGVTVGNDLNASEEKYLQFGASIYTGVASRLSASTSISSTINERTAHPQLKLIAAMAPWSVLESSKGSYNWTQMNTNVQDAHDRGYKIILRIMAGPSAPNWLYTQGVQSVTIRADDDTSQQYCQPIRIPVYWDSALKTHYSDLMTEVGRWLNEPLSDGTSKRDYIYFVPVAMATQQGTEMSLGYGPDETCSDGVNIRINNRAAWDATGVNETDRRVRTEQAWKDSIDIHMTKLPVASSVAYGHIFNDSQAAAKRIVAEKVAANPERLWTMYTSLRPNVRADGSLGPYSEWCPRCHEVLTIAIDLGGSIGFQTAAATILNTPAKFTAAAEDGLSTYSMKFFETSPALIDQYQNYLLTDPNNLQQRM